MAPTAVFLKPVINGVPVRFDGFDRFAQYQMVPAGGERRVLLLTDKNEWLLEQVDDSGALQLSFPSSAQPQQIIVEGEPRFVIPPFSNLQIALRGVKPGRAGLVLLPRDLTVFVVNKLDVSVKRLLKKTFAIWMLRTPFRSPQRPENEAAFLMGRTSDFYFSQTNMELVQVGSPEIVLVDLNLDDSPDLTPSVENDIRKTTRQLDKNPADLWVYFVWNIKGAAGVGGSSLAFVRDDLGTDSFSDTALIVPAHEIGHALGLDHILLEDFLMFPTANQGGLNMTMTEIDKINPSGVEPIKPIQKLRRAVRAI
jgi:hypothetical protein